MCKYTYWFIIVGPILILLLDFLICFVDPRATITCVVRDLSEKSVWPEVIYLLGALALYLHLFRGAF